MIIKLLFIIGSAFSYELISDFNLTKKDIDFYPCIGLNPILKEKTIEVFEEINDLDMYNLNLKGQTYPVGFNEVNTICDYDKSVSNSYGYCSFYPPTNETDIMISNALFNYPNNLYNVLLHEIIHALGLNHSKENYGIMNYSVSLNSDYSLINDRHLYLSIDDINGLKYLFNKNKQKEEKECKKRNILKLIRSCF